MRWLKTPCRQLTASDFCTLAKRLTEEGHSVDCCFDGRDGLDYAEAADYDCIVLN